MTNITQTFNENAKKPKTSSTDKPSPFCLRLSREERDILENAAGDTPRAKNSLCARLIGLSCDSFIVRVHYCAVDSNGVINR